MNSAAIEQAADLFRRRDILLEELQGIDSQIQKLFTIAPSTNGTPQPRDEDTYKVLSPEHPLRLYMMQNGLSQKHLSTKLKCSLATITNWLGGKSQPVGDLKAKLQDLLGAEEFDRMLRWPQSHLGRRVATASR